METCEDIRQTIGMKDLYSHRKETIERIFGTAKRKTMDSDIHKCTESADENEGRAHLCVYEFKKACKM